MTTRPKILVMGILNATPDSFYDGGRWDSVRAAVDAGLAMIDDGADILDIGGESTRPGAHSVSADMEMERVLPILTALRAHTDIPISIDTTKAIVASAALQEGASIINDISALRFDENMASVIAHAGCRVVLMHMRGTPRTMQQAPSYENVVDEVTAFLLERARAAQEAGIPAESIIVDPGIGFGKTVKHNVALLQGLPKLAATGYPVLVGLSRKSFLGRLSNLAVDERLEATIAANTAAILGGARILRVHDVKEGRRTADIAGALRA